MAATATKVRRGAFIVFEGLDRSGKSTQVQRLVDSLNKDGVKAVACRFPDRTTTIGTMINSYLTQESELDDRAIHLLFSANRWERAKGILAQLEAGTTVVCDRYAFSGIAFSVAKGLPYNWCLAPDVSLPAPDLTLFLSLSPAAAAARGGFGAERYETSELQLKVREVFTKIGKYMDAARWKEVDAAGTLDEVEATLRKEVDGLLSGGVSEEVGRLWEDRL